MECCSCKRTKKNQQTFSAKRSNPTNQPGQITLNDLYELKTSTGPAIKLLLCSNDLTVYVRMYIWMDVFVHCIRTM